MVPTTETTQDSLPYGEVGVGCPESQFNRLRSGTLFLVLNKRVNVYLNFPKYPFLCSFALANVLTIVTGSIVSVNVLWLWTSMQLFNWSCFIVLLRYVMRRLKAEKLRPDVETHIFKKKMEVGHAYSKIKWTKTQLIHWKSNQFRCCTKIVFLSPNELNEVK